MPSINEFIPFKDCIWYGNISELDFEKLKEFSYSVRQQDQEGITASNKGGWHSKVISYNDQYKFFDEFEKLLNIVGSAIEYGVKKSYDKDLTAVYNSSWININDVGNYNVLHIHPKSTFSSVVYLSDSSSPITFSDFGTMRSTFIEFNSTTDVFSTSFDFVPNKGDYFIFPAWMPHSVQPATAERISIAANFHIRKKDEQ